MSNIIARNFGVETKGGSIVLYKVWRADGRKTTRQMTFKNCPHTQAVIDSLRDDYGLHLYHRFVNESHKANTARNFAAFCKSDGLRGTLSSYLATYTESKAKHERLTRFMGLNLLDQILRGNGND